METYIKKKLEGRVMEALFNDSSIVNIKYFRALNLDDESQYDRNKKYFYEIKIRHPEDSDPKILLNAAIADLEESI